MLRFFLIGLGVLLMGCGGNSFRSLSSSSNSSFQSYSKACQLVDGNIVKDVVTNILGFKGGQVPMVDVSGKLINSASCKTYSAISGEGEVSCYYLDVYEQELTDPSCDSASFKILSEIFINACSFGLQDSTIKNKLFPGGFGNFDALFINLTGRKPDKSEIELLNSISSSDSNKKLVMACAAVATSLSALTVY